MKPRLLDLFCGAGGAAKGYQRAGFYVVGVDIKPQPRYCGDEFVLDDAFEHLASMIRMDEFGLGWGFDAVHASPLWWQFTAQGRQNGNADRHADDLTPTLALLEQSGLPFVLEVGTLSPQEAVTICGISCGLRVTRHMRFVTSWPLMVPPCSHHHGGAADGLYVPYRGSYHKEPGHRKTPHRRKDWREAAGVEWMNTREADLCVPPAYTELIGEQLMHHIRVGAAA